MPLLDNLAEVAKSDFPKTICANVVGLLREERIRAQMPMIRLAEEAGLSVAMVSFVERGLRNPTLDTLLRMAQALNLDLWRLIKQASSRVYDAKSN